jgi:hypothetical protein
MFNIIFGSRVGQVMDPKLKKGGIEEKILKIDKN